MADFSSLGKASGGGSEMEEFLRAVGQLWQNGISVDRDILFEGKKRNKLQLPTYPFERTRHWVEPGNVEISGGADFASETLDKISAEIPSDASPKERLIIELKDILEASSGLELEGVSDDTTFLEMGLDSLFLTQVALTLQKKFKTKVTFRQLNEELCDLDRLAGYLGEHAGHCSGAKSRARHIRLSGHVLRFEA